MLHLHQLDTERLQAERARDGYAWVDLRDPAPEDLHAAGTALGIPALAIEDSSEFDQRPKIDDYRDRVLVVFYGAHEDRLAEVHLHVSGTEVVTIRRDGVDALDHVDVDRARSEEDLVYRLLDALTDGLVDLVDRRMAEVEALEEAAYEHAGDDARRRIAVLRGELFGLRQVVAAQRDLLARGADRLECVPGLQREEARHPFRDIHDDLVTTANRLDYGRELLGQALEVHLAQQSNRLNAVATRLTLVATVFLPLTFVTGFFGQNFGWMVGRIDSFEDFVLFGGGASALAVGLPLFVFWRTGLLRRRS